MQLPTWSAPPDVRECRCYGKAIRDRCEQKGPGKKPLNVVIVGIKGSGKSSFINSLAASLSHERWIEYSTAGICSGTRPVTSYICKFKQCCNEEASFYENVLLPTLTDTPGLMEVEADDPQTLKFLRLLFYGHIQDHADALQVYADCKRGWNDLLETYPRQYDGTRADRVIFVASAVQDLPYRLMDCVMKAARPPPNPAGIKRQIPVYGVLTHIDKAYGSTVDRFKDGFKLLLGLDNGRFLSCKNYCDETDPCGGRLTGVRHSLDLPILKFFAQVCDRRVKIINDDDMLRPLRMPCNLMLRYPETDENFEFREGMNGVANVHTWGSLRLQNYVRRPGDTPQIKELP